MLKRHRNRVVRVKVGIVSFGSYLFLVVFVTALLGSTFKFIYGTSCQWTITQKMVDQGRSDIS